MNSVYGELNSAELEHYRKIIKDTFEIVKNVCFDTLHFLI